MKITEQKVMELAHLARLEFQDAQVEAIQNDLEKIIAFCEKLNEVDTIGIAPLIYLSKHNNELREDIVVEDITQDQGLKNAPSADSDYFRVPKVIKQQK
jgi:aspartyl-tRNA(Asn)/glutamyl-tRNA(Gln) amidotransferase subunit C